MMYLDAFFGTSSSVLITQQLCDTRRSLFWVSAAFTEKCVGSPGSVQLARWVCIV